MKRFRSISRDLDVEIDRGLFQSPQRQELVIRVIFN
jgi:hypothetical protein